MKKILNSTWTGAAAAVLVTSIGLTQSAQAITLVYEEGPNIGQAYIGSIEMKFGNFDMGTLYAPGSAGGFSGSPGAGVLGGIAATNLIPGQVPAGFTFPGTLVPASPEDTWGILRVSEILDANTGFKVWTSAAKGTEITGIFYGGQDFFVEPDPNNPATDVRINSAGLILSFWEQTLGISDFNPTLGPGARTSLTDYPTVSGPGEGANVLTIRSTPGFIHTNVGSGGPSAVAGGSAAEVEAIFNGGALSGLGTSFGNVIGGTQAANFDLNGITSPAGAFNFGAGIIPSAFTDVKLNFTSTPGTSGWLVRSNDPLSTDFVPEPGNFLAGLGCMLPMFGVFFGRRRQRQVAA